MSDKNVIMSEDDLGTLNVGNVAGLVYGHMKPILDKIAVARTNDLKADYRKGEFDTGRAIATVAALCVIDDIDNQLRSQINRKEGVLSKLEKEES
jgi:hypothetical protein